MDLFGKLFTRAIKLGTLPTKKSKMHLISNVKY